MINPWITFVGVLKSSPNAICNSKDHARLCYGIAARRPNNAQFISCYNTARLIPHFTAYVVPYRTGPALTGYKRPAFRKDNGNCGRYQHRHKSTQYNVLRVKVAASLNNNVSPCPNFSCEFLPTRFFSVLLWIYYIVRNRELSSSFTWKISCIVRKFIKKLHIRNDYGYPALRWENVLQWRKFRRHFQTLSTQQKLQRLK